MKSKVPKLVLPPKEEWDFSGVPPKELRWCYAWELCREAFKGAKFDTAGGRPANSDQLLDVFLLLKDAGLERFQGVPWLKIPADERRRAAKCLAVRPTEDPTRDVLNTIYRQTDDTKETFSVYFGPTYSRMTEKKRFDEWLTKKEEKHQCSPRRKRDPFAMLQALAALRLKDNGIRYRQAAEELGLLKTRAKAKELSRLKSKTHAISMTYEISNLRSDVCTLRKALKEIRGQSFP